MSNNPMFDGEDSSSRPDPTKNQFFPEAETKGKLATKPGFTLDQKWHVLAAEIASKKELFPLLNSRDRVEHHVLVKGLLTIEQDIEDPDLREWYRKLAEPELFRMRVAAKKNERIRDEETIADLIALARTAIKDCNWIEVKEILLDCRRQLNYYYNPVFKSKLQEVITEMEKYVEPTETISKEDKLNAIQGG